MRTRYPALGRAWLLLCAALALHVVDEAVTGFLAVYNPTVVEIRARLPLFPIEPFSFSTWLAGLVVAIVLLFCLSPLAFANVRWFRPLAWFLAVLMMLNALGHTAATIAGRTFANITFPRPMPGFWSSPILLAAAVYLMVRLRRTTAPRDPG